MSHHSEIRYVVRYDPTQPRGLKRKAFTPLHDIPYYSRRYDLTVTAKEGLASDGASGTIDTAEVARAFFVHDAICKNPVSDEGVPITAWMAQMIVGAILVEDKRWWRAIFWQPTTFLFGCKKARRNGWFRLKGGNNARQQ